MKEELDSMEEAEVWGQMVELPYEVKATPLKFLFTKKLGAEGMVERYKARLVFVNRNKDEGWSEFYAPVINKTNLRIFLAFVATRKWELQQAEDVKTAFFNAKIDRDVYVKIPAILVQDEDNGIQKLNKAIYRLRAAQRAWNETFTLWATTECGMISDYEPCLFRTMNGKALIVIYVDDILVWRLKGKGGKHVG
jgi:hypothetical protein